MNQEHHLLKAGQVLGNTLQLFDEGFCFDGYLLRLDRLTRALKASIWVALGWYEVAGLV